MERPGLIDRATANVVEEFWVANDALDTSKQILSNSEPNVTTMMMMCNPVLDHPSGTGWNRDIHPEDMAPMDALTADFVENGPSKISIPVSAKNGYLIVQSFPARRIKKDVQTAPYNRMFG